MSAAVRQEIADAASAAPGITCTPYYAPVTSPGAAHVRLDRTEYPNKFGGIDFWQVVVRLPQALDEAEKYIEQHRQALYDAVGQAIVVTEISPQLVVFDYGSAPLPCLIVAGHRAQEEE